LLSRWQNNGFGRSRQHGSHLGDRHWQGTSSLHSRDGVGSGTRLGFEHRLLSEWQIPSRGNHEWTWGNSRLGAGYRKGIASLAHESRRGGFHRIYFGWQEAGGWHSGWRDSFVGGRHMEAAPPTQGESGPDRGDRLCTRQQNAGVSVPRQNRLPVGRG